MNTEELKKLQQSFCEIVPKIASGSNSDERNAYLRELMKAFEKVSTQDLESIVNDVITKMTVNGNIQKMTALDFVLYHKFNLCSHEEVTDRNGETLVMTMVKPVSEICNPELVKLEDLIRNVGGRTSEELISEGSVADKLPGLKQEVTNALEILEQEGQDLTTYSHMVRVCKDQLNTKLNEVRSKQVPAIGLRCSLKIPNFKVSAELQTVEDELLTNIIIDSTGRQAISKVKKVIELLEKENASTWLNSIEGGKELKERVKEVDEIIQKQNKELLQPSCLQSPTTQRHSTGQNR